MPMRQSAVQLALRNNNAVCTTIVIMVEDDVDLTGNIQCWCQDNVTANIYPGRSIAVRQVESHLRFDFSPRRRSRRAEVPFRSCWRWFTVPRGVVVVCLRYGRRVPRPASSSAQQIDFVCSGNCWHWSVSRSWHATDSRTHFLLLSTNRWQAHFNKIAIYRPAADHSGY